MTRRVCRRLARVCLALLLVSALLPFAAARAEAQTAGFRILTWNVHHGFTPAEEYVFAAQVRAMVASGADVLCLQEVQTWDEFARSTVANAFTRSQTVRVTVR